MDPFCVMKYEAKDDGSGNAISQAASAPWVSISQVDAKAECAALGAKYDLISNPEWLALAKDIEAQDINWSGGSVGSGCLSRGNNGVDDACGYDGADPEFGAGRDPKAKHTLSNGEEIYDLSANVSEWTDWSLGGGLTSGPTTCPDNGFEELQDVSCGALSRWGLLARKPLRSGLLLF